MTRFFLCKQLLNAIHPAIKCFICTSNKKRFIELDSHQQPHDTRTISLEKNLSMFNKQAHLQSKMQNNLYIFKCMRVQICLHICVSVSDYVRVLDWVLISNPLKNGNILGDQIDKKNLVICASVDGCRFGQIRSTPYT